MKVCVMGAGVVGLTTAWRLVEDGHDVTLVDRGATPATETSHANGAQLSYRFVAPFASPDTLRKLPSLLFGPDAPVRVRPRLDAGTLSWMLAFLRCCRSGTVERTVAAQLALAALSQIEMLTLKDAAPFDFDMRSAGKLILFRQSAGFDAARRAHEAEPGSEATVLDPSGCLALEPALTLDPRSLSGGIYNAGEQVGDCRLFCERVFEALGRRNSIRFAMDTRIEAPVIRTNRLVGLKTDKGEIEADCFVLSLATGAVAFASEAGLRLPIYPLKGYSITAPLVKGRPLPSHSVTDFDRKIVMAPLAAGNEPLVRIAGHADIVGEDRTIDAGRIASLKRLACACLTIDTEAELQPWAGLRPATPDSRPIIGWSPVKGLFINTGHGGLGWTLAAGSARIATDLIGGRPPPIDVAPFRYGR